MQAMERFPQLLCAGVLLCLLLGGMTVRAQGNAQAVRPVISDVIIQGSQRMDPAQIKARLRTQPGKEYDPAALDEDVRELYKTRQFSNIQPYIEADGPGKVKIYFGFRDLPNQVQKITFLGAKHIKPEDLRKEIGIRTGTPLNPRLNQEGCHKIVEKYEEKGRSFATCRLLKGDKLSDTEVVYQITEGPKVKVSSIKFIGNRFVSSAVLATHIKSSHAWFHILGGNYNSKLVDADINELRKYYKTFGYQDVKISPETQRSADGGSVTLIFHIQEGPRYTVQEIPQVVNAKSIPHEQLEAMATMKSGEYLDENKIKVDEARIRNYYGYTGRQVQVQHNYLWSKDTPGVMQVQYLVEEKPQARVGQVFIIGNTRTRDNVILRQVPLFPGQILTYPDMEIAQFNLRRLNIFTSGKSGPAPSVTVLNPESESVFKDIRIDVNEANTGSLIFGVGVNSNSGLTGSIILNERNFDIFNPPTSFSDFLNGQAFRGAGQEFRIQAMPGTQLQQYMATFREPYLFDTPNSLTLSGYYFTRYYNEYYEQRTGFRPTLGRQLNRFWNVSLGMRVENVAVHNVAEGAPIDYQEAVGNNFQIGFRGGVTRDTRDSFIHPTRGSQIQFSYEEVTGEHTFPLINLLANKYWTTYQRADGSGRHVLVYHGQTGWAGTTTPVYERFFAGGFTTIRGFQFRGVGPNINGYMIGGDYLLLNSLEYQIPVKADDKIYVVGFVDSGTVATRINDFDNYRVSVGFGLRFTIPMLGPTPIALDFGFPVHKAPSDITQVFNFWMGFTR